MPSLPASDGFQNPVQSSGLNSKICNPINQLLDRSVSAPAPVCSSESSLAEPIGPRASKSYESSTKCQISLEEDDHLLLQHLSSNASLADTGPSPQAGEGTCCSPACLLQETLKEPLIADSLEECNSKEQEHGQERPLEGTEENGVADAAAAQGQSKDPCLSLEQEPELPIGQQTCKDPRKEHLEEQTETTDRETSCHVAGVEKPVVEEANQPENSLKGTLGDGWEKARLSCMKGSIQTSASCSCVHTEVFMEIDVDEQSAAEVHSSASQQRQEAQSSRVSDLSSDAFSMEMEMLKSVSSLADLLPTSADLQPESTEENPAKLSDLVPEGCSSPSGICQQDTDPGRPSEEPCSSLASALKELHKLLIISRKGECKTLTSEEESQSEMAHRKPAAQQKGPSDSEEKGSDPASQEQSCSFYEVRSEGERAEGKQLSGSGTEHLSSGAASHTRSALGEGALEVQRFAGKSDSVLVNSAAAPGQQQSSEQEEFLAEDSQSPAGPALEQNTSVLSTLALDEGAAEATPHLYTEAPGRSSGSAPEGPWLLGGCEELLLSPPAGHLSGAAPPPAFPAADVARILSAGFTTREALEALERADGNTDLALLILLAKSIVVPT
ncbi:RSCA1 protein, partial [Rhinopomastus cyanomelas]|nr:RSCA1 protein [Rhinopomastus cyanomelas]